MVRSHPAGLRTELCFPAPGPVLPFFITPRTQRRDPDPVTPGQGSLGGLEPKRERPLLHLPLETTGPLAPERVACCQPRAVGWPAGHSPCPPPPPGRLSVLDLSAQAIIYEVATVVYMVRLNGDAFAMPCPQPGPLTAWGCQRRGRGCPFKGCLCLPRDPLDLLHPPGPARHTWPTAALLNSRCCNCFELIGTI